MSPPLRSIADLLDTVQGGSTPLVSVPETLPTYQPSLLLVADVNGNVIAADDFGCEMRSRGAEPLAMELAGALEVNDTCRFTVTTDEGPQLVLGVRLPGSLGQEILGCLVPYDERSGRRLAEIGTAQIVCGAFAWAVLRGKATNATLHRRIKHLVAEKDTLRASHSEAVIAVIKAREEQRHDQEEKAALEELMRATEAANRGKSQFLANASHELRTPLTAILGFADLLADGNLSPQKQREHVQTIRRNGEVLLRVINDILDLSKIEAGKMAIEPADCSPWEIVEDLVSLMQVQAEQKGLRLEADYRFPIPGMIHVDAVRLRQILMNLIGNAIKFTKRGGVQITVGWTPPADRPSGDSLEQTTTAGTARLEFAVRDTGMGIAPEMLLRLFTPFTQADSSTTRRFGGTGLGLAISRRLAEMLGGKIEVESKLGQGSTFTLSMELVLPPAAPMLHAPPEPAAREVQPAPANPDQALRGRVLLAEDGKDNQRLIGFVLEKAGLEVDMADNGQVACQYAAASTGAGKPYDLILMDMQMPELDGYEATRRLRQDGWQGPIVALTAHVMAEDRRKCLEAGCSDYLTKPIDRGTFLATVTRHLAGAGAGQFEGKQG